jgi:transcriptional regulator
MKPKVDLTDQQTKDILLDTRKQKDIAREYGITQVRISNIKRNFKVDIFKEA